MLIDWFYYHPTCYSESSEGSLDRVLLQRSFATLRITGGNAQGWQAGMTGGMAGDDDREKTQNNREIIPLPNIAVLFFSKKIGSTVKPTLTTLHNQLKFMKNSSLVIFCFVLFIFSNVEINNAEASQPNSNISGAAFADLYLGKGEITKEQYDDFWKQVGVKDRQEKEIVIASMRSNFLLMQDHQREVWACAQKAWNLRKVPKCNKLEKKFKLLSASIGKSSPQDTMTKIKDSSDSIVRTAANRGKYKLDGGGEMQMSLAFIQKTKGNLDALFSRFDRMLQVNY